MKNLILIIVLLISLDAFAEKKYQKTFYGNGNIKSEGWIENFQKIRFWRFYYENGNLKKEGHFSADKESKYWKFYTRKGHIEKEGHFENGKKNNWWLFYDKKEKINHKCQLKDNQKNGYCLVYNNEKLVAASKYKAGKKLKEWTTFASFKRENNHLTLIGKLLEDHTHIELQILHLVLLSKLTSF